MAMVDEKEPAESTQIMVRLTPDLKGRVKKLIDKGKFTTYSDFMKSAAIEKLIREETGEVLQINLLAELEKPEVKQKLKELWLGFLRDMK